MSHVTQLPGSKATTMPPSSRRRPGMVSVLKRRNARKNRDKQKRVLLRNLARSDPDSFMEKFEAQGGNRTSKRRTLDLRLIIGGAPLIACADTGSEKNIMNQQTANLLRLEIREGQPDRPLAKLQLGNGKLVCPLYQVRTFVEFPDEHNTRQQSDFYVLRNCAIPIIMGSDFLDATQCMTVNKHRLQSRVNFHSELALFRSIGTPKRRLPCFVDNKLVYAIADSGSELDLMSLDFAKRHGYYRDNWDDQDSDDENCDHPQQPSDGTNIGIVRVGLADGTLVETFGDVPVQIAFGNGTDAPVIRMFHIIDSPPSDIILGQDLLHETDAFIRYEHCFIELYTTSTAFELNRFIWLRSAEKGILSIRNIFNSRRNNQNPVSVEQQLLANYTEECRRRECAVRAITAERGPKQAVAEAEERRKQENYKREQRRIIEVIREELNESDAKECYRRESAESEILLIQEPHRAAAIGQERQMQENYDSERQRLVAIFSSAQACGP